MTLDFNGNKHAVTTPTPADRFQRGRAAERHRPAGASECPKPGTDTTDTLDGVAWHDSERFQAPSEADSALPVEVERDLARILGRVLVEQFRRDAALPVVPDSQSDAVPVHTTNHSDGRPTRARTSSPSNPHSEWSGLP